MMLSSMSASLGPVGQGHTYYEDAYYDDDDDDQAVVVHPEESFLATIAEEGDELDSEDGAVHRPSALSAVHPEEGDDGDGHLWDEDDEDDDGYEDYYEDDYGDGFANEPYGNEFLDTILEEEDEDADSSSEEGGEEEDPKPPPAHVMAVAAALMDGLVEEKKDLEDDVLATTPFNDSTVSSASEPYIRPSTTRSNADRPYLQQQQQQQYPSQHPSAERTTKRESTSKQRRGNGLDRSLTPHPGFADADVDEKASERLARGLAAAEMRKAEQGRGTADQSEDDFCTLESQSMNLGGVASPSGTPETDNNDDIPSLSGLTGKEEEEDAELSPATNHTNRGSLLQGEDDFDGRAATSTENSQPEISARDVEQGADDEEDSDEDIPHATRLESPNEDPHQRPSRSSMESASATSATASTGRSPSTRRRWESFLRVPQATVTAVLPRVSQNTTNEEVEEHNNRANKLGCHHECSCTLGIFGILTLAALFLLVLGAAIVLGVLFLSSQRGNGDSTNTIVEGPDAIETLAPSFSPPTLLSPAPQRDEELLEVVSEFVYDPATLQNTSSPQYLAYRWLVNTDPIQLDPISQRRRLMQRYVLYVGFYSLGGPQIEQTMHLFDYGQHECDINVPLGNIDFGIDCETLVDVRDDGSKEEDRFVVALRFGLDILHGELYPEAARLEPFLRVFDLSSNAIQGTIPTIFGSFGDGFQVLSLGRNNLHGTIPTELGNLKGLQILNLRETKLTGPIPTQLAQLPSLQQLDLSNNPFLEGTFPQAMSALSTSLNQLYLQRTNLEGSLAFMCPRYSQNVISPSSDASYVGFLSDCGQLSHENLTLSPVPRIDCPCCTGCYPSEVPRVDEPFDQWECLSPDEIKFDLELVSDGNGHQTTWSLTTQLMHSPNIFVQRSSFSESQNFTRVVARDGTFWSSTRNRQMLCLPRDHCYTWTVDDLGGNGLCCSGGNGKVTLRINDEILVSNIGPDTFQSSRSWSFGEC